MSKEFKVGDRVKVVESNNLICSPAVLGDEGKVVCIRSGNKILVEFDKERKDLYHTGLGRCRSGHGYWCLPDMLQRIDLDEKIVITTDGKTTLARHFKGKTLICGSMTECSPSDTFDFLTGAGIVFDRLTKTEKKQYKTEPKFKAGDLVRVIGSGHDIMHSIFINSLAVVVGVSNDARNGYDYLCEGGSRSGLVEQWIHEKDLEKFEIKKESK
jgi:hypothetical protein